MPAKLENELFTVEAEGKRGSLNTEDRTRG